MRVSISRGNFLHPVRLAAAALALAASCVVAAGEWAPLARDGLHDPKSPAVKLLQQPGDALSRLTPDTTGNQVRWPVALEKGEIKPREKLRETTQVQILDQDILLNLKGGMPIVRFPHKLHTLWLDCTNCHDGLFKKETGATKLSMLKILEGEQCGVCHGAVAFPLTECYRCHSIPRLKSEADSQQPTPLPVMPVMSGPRLR